MTVYIGECARSTAEYLNGTPLGFGTGNLILLAGAIVLGFLLVLHLAGGVRYKWARDVRIGVYAYASTLALLYLHDVRQRPRREELAYELCTVEPAGGIPIAPFRPPAARAPQPQPYLPAQPQPYLPAQPQPYLPAQPAYSQPQQSQPPFSQPPQSQPAQPYPQPAQPYSQPPQSQPPQSQPAPPPQPSI